MHRSALPRQRLSSAPPSERQVGGVLVAVTFDEPSAVALRRGRALALRIGVPMRVVHVATEPDAGASSADPDHAELVRALLRWATERAGVALDAADVTVRSGKALPEIWREAHMLDAELLVLGGSVEGCEPPGWLVRFLAQHARRPVLVASETHKPSIVAATDLSDGDLPVLHYAAALAERAGWFLHGVHNTESDFAHETTPGGGRAAAASSVEAHACLDDLAHDDLLADEVEITDDTAPSDAILRVARISDADVVAVGVHETAGRTLRELVSRANRSVLAIPLGRGRSRAPTPYPPSLQAVSHAPRSSASADKVMFMALAQDADRPKD